MILNKLSEKEMYNLECKNEIQVVESENYSGVRYIIKDDIVTIQTGKNGILSMPFQSFIVLINEALDVFEHLI